MSGMKIIILAFIISIGATFVSGQQTARVISVKANLRGAPSSSSAVFATFNQNTKLSVLDSKHNNGWYYVARGKLKGWIQGSAIELLDSESDRKIVRAVDAILRDMWEQYAATEDLKYSYNVGSLVRSGRLRTVWTRGQNKSSDRVVSKTLFQIECGTFRRYRILSSVQYGDGGEVLQSLDTPNEQFSFVVPDTLADGLYEAMCQ